MKLLLINSAEPENRTFVEPIENIASQTEANTTTVEYSSIPTNIDDYDAVIISASPKGDDIVDTHLPLFEWVKTFRGAVLGICAGHQLMGKLFGADLIRDQEAEDGLMSVQITQADPIFEGHEKELTAEQQHNDSITLPEDFDLIATSSKCRVQAMRHKERPLYSVQWHPEKSNPEIISNFINEVVHKCSN